MTPTLRRFELATWLLILAMGTADTAVCVAQVRLPRVRTISNVAGSIEQQLLPDDDVVIITSDRGGSAMTRQPTRAQLINYQRDWADVAVVAEVVGMSGIAIDGEAWIGTRVMAKTYDVLMNKKPIETVAPTRRIEFQTSDGELMIGSVLVKAGRIPTMQLGRTYLLFLRRNQDSGILAPSFPPLLVERGQITAATEEWQPGMRNPLVGQSLAKVAALLRSK